MTEYSAPHWMTLAFSKNQVKRAFFTSMIVGTLLNLINQGQVLWTEESLNVFKFLLTYLVPYCVATFAGTTSSLSFLNDLPEHCDKLHGNMPQGDAQTVEVNSKSASQ